MCFYVFRTIILEPNKPTYRKVGTQSHESNIHLEDDSRVDATLAVLVTKDSFFRIREVTSDFRKGS